MQEKENILSILEETKTSFQKGDSATIKNLSNRTTNTAALTQDPDNIAVAVIVYSISKLLEREDYRKLPAWKEFYKIVLSGIDNTINSIKKNEEAKISENLNLLRKSIGQVSGNLKKYIQDVFRKASINKASKLYEHGLSMEKTADLLGITMFELASYAGQKESVSEIPFGKGISTKTRIKTAMEMFR